MRIAILKTQANSTSLSPNISLKESATQISQISSNDETSLNNNIKSNSDGGFPVGFNSVEVIK